ncbi:pyridoxamine 5'-phosphate oxidase family protein [Anaerococcus cruorum]|uniref:pyridoxamine 5'-phosphate oxidase family protein n=1 Tax=Anaerococcus sp. WGS1596 TaxID=3366806 RepID=UPI00372CF5E9
MTDIKAREKRYQAYQIIDRAEYGLISMANNNEAYGVPMSIIRIGDSLYFHTGQKGKKIDFLKENPRVSISFVGEVEVPDLYDKNQIKEMVADPSKHGKFVNTVFTTNFESVIVNGDAELLLEDKEKIEVMRAICQKYTPNMIDYFDIPITRSLNITNVYKVSIENFKVRSKKVKV